LRPQRPLILIPARLASTRFPGKPLVEIDGRAMILHTLDRAREAGLGPVAVATDSVEIAQTVEAAGGRAALTRGAHASGSDRLGEALAALDPGGAHDAVINLQGDEPFLPQGALEAALALLADAAVDIGTLATPASEAEGDDQDAVKLVATQLAPQRLRALYFTRARAPYGPGPLFRHIGVYAYRRAALARFIALPPSPLETRERLEQLRALEAGMRIDAAVLDKAPPAVDRKPEP
jgi:3-deoxy-manno-octulosonate cytidylyltransferase (CMP-KDO synthetase)